MPNVFLADGSAIYARILICLCGAKLSLEQRLPSSEAARRYTGKSTASAIEQAAVALGWRRGPDGREVCPVCSVKGEA